MSRKLLIIDDSASMRYVIMETLREAGYEPVGAGSPEDGLRELAAQKFSLILLDLNMPGMNGLELIQQSRTGNSPNRFTPFLIVTTERDEALKAQGRSAGASAWLVKPFEMVTLLAAVRKLVETE